MIVVNRKNAVQAGIRFDASMPNITFNPAAMANSDITTCTKVNVASDSPKIMDVPPARSIGEGDITRAGSDKPRRPRGRYCRIGSSTGG
jgi:hypothetical protein